MRIFIRWITGTAGLLITLIGLLAMWRVLLPEGGVRAAGVEGWMFLGPALVTFGLLLCWTAGLREPRAGSLEARAPGLMFQVGLGFLALPAATWFWNSRSGTEASGYAWSFAAFAFGVPGVALALTGAVLWIWRKRSGSARG